MPASIIESPRTRSMKSWPSPVKSSGSGQRLLDVLGREDAGAGGDVADERDVADRAALDGRAGVGLEQISIARGLRGVAAEVALVLQRREVRVHRGARREADGLADLAHARRVARGARTSTSMNSSTCRWRAVSGCCLRSCRRTVTRSDVRGKHLFEISLDSERAFVVG